MWQIKKIKAITTLTSLMSRQGGAKIQEMLEALDIPHRRTLYRYIEHMEELQIPLYQERSGNEVVYKIVEEYAKKYRKGANGSAIFSYDEVLALFLLKGAAPMLIGTGFEQEMQAAFDKVETNIFPELRTLYRRLERVIIPSSKLTKDYTGMEDCISTVTDAILEQTTCQVCYRSFQREATKEFVVNPLHLFEHHGGLYLFVQVPKYDDIRMLAIERIQKITPDSSSLRFSYPEDFDPEEELSKSMGIIWDDPIEAAIWFSGKQAKYIQERKYCPEQCITENPDGSIVLTLKTSGRLDVKKLVLSCGKEAELLSPADLREELKAEFKDLQKRYTM